MGPLLSQEHPFKSPNVSNSESKSQQSKASTDSSTELTSKGHRSSEAPPYITSAVSKIFNHSYVGPLRDETPGLIDVQNKPPSAKTGVGYRRC